MPPVATMVKRSATTEDMPPGAVNECKPITSSLMLAVVGELRSSRKVSTDTPSRNALSMVIGARLTPSLFFTASETGNRTKVDP